MQQKRWKYFLVTENQPTIRVSWVKVWLTIALSNSQAEGLAVNFQKNEDKKLFSHEIGNVPNRLLSGKPNECRVRRLKAEILVGRPQDTVGFPRSPFTYGPAWYDQHRLLPVYFEMKFPLEVYQVQSREAMEFFSKFDWSMRKTQLQAKAQPQAMAMDTATRPLKSGPEQPCFPSMGLGFITKA